MVEFRCGKTAAGEPEGKQLEQHRAKSPGHGRVRGELKHMDVLGPNGLN